jgi:tetratricopeptide (TPR) repeat protein
LHLGHLLALAALMGSVLTTVQKPAGSGSVALPLHVRPGDADTVAGFEAFYNMDYPAALAHFERAYRARPADPFTVNHLLEAVLFAELHREGKLDAQLYLSNAFVHLQSSAPPAPVRQRIAELLAKAFRLEAARLSANPRDADALYARSVTRGLQATYQALVERAWFAALRSGLHAYSDARHVLELQPAYSDALLIVGIYNYVVGSLPWPVRAAAFLATIHGSKAHGLEMIRQAMEGGGEASVDARTTLALFLAREHRYQEALALAHWLYTHFPGNFLYGLAEADLLKAAGQDTQAESAYRHLIELGLQGRFPNQLAELAAFNLGNLYRSQRRWRQAAVAYDSVSRFPSPDPMVLAKAILAAGEMYDLAGDRTTALARYRAVAASGTDRTLAEQARRYLKRPYRHDDAPQPE